MIVFVDYIVCAYFALWKVGFDCLGISLFILVQHCMVKTMTWFICFLVRSLSLPVGMSQVFHTTVAKVENA